jgi:hypothetical protein
VWGGWGEHARAPVGGCVTALCADMCACTCPCRVSTLWVQAEAAGVVAAADIGTPRRRGHEFRARRSHFDREHFHHDRRGDLHGFLHLFSIAIVFYMVVTVLRAVRTGSVTAHVHALWATMSRDLLVLGVADLVLILFTFTAWLLQAAVARRWVGGWAVPVLQHLLQAALFGLAALFIYARDWPWVQSGSLMMHAIVLFMKMHSYTATNRELAAVCTHSLTQAALQVQTCMYGCMCENADASLCVCVCMVEC